MAARKTIKKKPPPLPLTIHTLTLTAREQTILHRLKGQATDELGRGISGSAIVRALVRFAGEQPPDWIRAQVLPQIDRELEAGTRWGKKAGGKSE